MGSRLNALGNGARSQRASVQFAVVHEDEGLGGAPGSQVEIGSGVLGRPAQPPCAGRRGNEDGFDAVCADHIAEADVYESLRGKCHIDMLLPNDDAQTSACMVGAAGFEPACRFRPRF